MDGHQHARAQYQATGKGNSPLCQLAAELIHELLLVVARTAINGRVVEKIAGPGGTRNHHRFALDFTSDNEDYVALYKAVAIPLNVPSSLEAIHRAVLEPP